MSKARKVCALLDDVDEHTFIRFSQYAYTGDHITADPVILLDSSTIVTTHCDPPEFLVERAEDKNEEMSDPMLAYSELEPAVADEDDA